MSTENQDQKNDSDDAKERQNDWDGEVKKAKKNLPSSTDGTN